MPSPTTFRAPGAGPSSTAGLVVEARLEPPAPVRPGFVLGVDPGTRVVGFGAVRLDMPPGGAPTGRGLDVAAEVENNDVVALADEIGNVFNLNVAVEEWGDDVVFLHNSSGAKQMTDGDKPLDNALFFSRLVRRQRRRRAVLQALRISRESSGNPILSDMIEEAAEAVGCEVSRIVKSLVFVVGDEHVMALVPGDKRLDTGKLARAAGHREPAARASLDDVRAVHRA